MSWRRRAIGVLVGTFAVGCAGGATHLPTPAPGASEVAIPAVPALKCDPTSAAAPLIFSLSPEQRGEIEALMKRQIVTARYECDKLAIVPDCAIDGSYGYVSVTPREQVMSLTSALEVRANLPLESSALLARVGPSLSTGSRLDVAFSIVGQQASVLSVVNRSQLKGECSAVTHFVRGASLGAFAIALAKGGPESVSDVFGGSSKLLQRDGSLEACHRQTDEDKRVPGCAAPLRLELRPVTNDTVHASIPTEEQPAQQCPGGTQPDDQGKCNALNTALPHVCSFADSADCETQCRAGSMGSCSLLGRNFQLGRGVKKDVERAKQLYALACRGGSPPACGRLGQLLVDQSATHEEGLELLRKSCKGGFFDACQEGLARLPASQANRAAELAQRGCDGGNAASCWALGQFFRGGFAGLEKNAADAARYLKLACDGGAPLGCASYTEVIDPGDAATAETAHALSVLQAACDGGVASACSRLGRYYGIGKGVASDFPKSMALIERACVGGELSSCLVTGLSYERGLGKPKDLVKAQQFLTRACESGDANACKEAEKLRATSAANAK
jgi:TPR repeat protein